MPRLAANLSFLYQELPFEARLAAAAQDGFGGVEFLSPYEWEPGWLAAQLRAHGLQQVLFNAPAGGGTLAAVRSAWAEGWRGTASLPGAQREFEYGIELALDYAQALGCSRIHVMSGTHPGQLVHGGNLRQQWLHRLSWAAERAARRHSPGAAPIVLLIEAINRQDMPGYWLHTQQQALAALQEIGHPLLGLQLDLYHCQMTEGHAQAELQRGLGSGLLHHVQIAAVPGRCEPDAGAVDGPALLRQLDAAGYSGWVGLEYRPRSSTRAGLGWAAPWLRPGGGAAGPRP